MRPFIYAGTSPNGRKVPQVAIDDPYIGLKLSVKGQGRSHRLIVLF
jgi:hypothetical protein